MADKEYLFPSREFSEEFFRLCQASEGLSKVLKPWGTNFNGDMCFVFQEIPLDNIDKCPENVQAYLKENVHDGSLYLYYECNGAMNSWTPAPPEKENDAGYVYFGTFPFWKEIFANEKEFVKEVLSGRVRIKGDMAMLMRNIKLIPEMQKVVVDLSANATFIDDL
ncbi:MAG: hypothetical protein JXA49_06635 [Actinobacteria bacterium]|nr:hypothetical protein [Actinomycetota bacterium]